MKYDVIVSGSGPAGSTAAKFSAKYGLKTLLIERHALNPRFEKPCGGAIPKQVFNDFKIPTKGIVEQIIYGSTVFAPNGDQYTIEIPNQPSGWNVKRSIFDKYLCDEALKKNVDVLENALVFDVLIKNNTVVGVKVKKNGIIKEIFSKLTIAADGVGSRIVKKAGLRKKWNPKEDLGKCAVAFISGYNLKNDENDKYYNQFYLSNEIAPNAYAWMFPLANNIVNIGLGIHRISNINPMEYLKKMIIWDKIKNKFVNPKILWKSNFPVPLCGIKGKTLTNGLIAIGDSVGFVSPMLGEGIYYAMWTGKIAAEIALEANEKDDFSKDGLNNYRKKYKALKFHSIFSTHKSLRDILMSDMEKNVNAIIKLAKTQEEAQIIIQSALAGDTREISSELMVSALDLIQKALKQ
ncbi:MAG: NAD(P)/FAD-dependent oxidoreductase [Candidatus Lokiarchaeota archaeon]|nr:NAD(P)/FAD-dependent oxidoreductase [Candidatus Lokiarchaeota archaeon]